MRWLAGTLLGLLALAWALLALAAPSREVRPAPDERGLGGLSRLAIALREAGYRVAFDRSTRPRLRRDDVVVAPVKSGSWSMATTPSVVLRHTQSGGRAFLITVSGALQSVGTQTTAKRPGGKTARIDATGSPTVDRPVSEIASKTVWSAEGAPIATIAQAGAGRIARLEVGSLATNRFLGRNDNAHVVLDTLQTVARPGDRLVFVASGYGEAEDPGPIEAIGPGAVGALWQALAVFAAFGLSKGVRFGLPVPDVRARRGARELLDALAGHYRRNRRTDAPLGAAARERPDDAEIATLANEKKVPESVARQALERLESRPKRRRE